VDGRSELRVQEALLENLPTLFFLKNINKKIKKEINGEAL